MSINPKAIKRTMKRGAIDKAIDLFFTALISIAVAIVTHYR